MGVRQWKAQGKKWLGGRWVQKYCEWMSYYRWKWKGSEMYSQRMERQVIEVDQWKQVVESISRQNSAVISREGLENQRNNMGGAEDREEDRQYQGWLAGQVRDEWRRQVDGSEMERENGWYTLNDRSARSRNATRQSNLETHGWLAGSEPRSSEQG